MRDLPAELETRNIYREVNQCYFSAALGGFFRSETRTAGRAWLPYLPPFVVIAVKPLGSRIIFPICRKPADCRSEIGKKVLRRRIVKSGRGKKGG